MPSLWCFRTNFVDEIKRNLKLGVPIIITNILQYLLFLETTAFAGRLPEKQFAGTGLALSLIHALGWTICTGMVSACDTMMSQAYGSDNKKRTGLFLQRAILMMNLIPLILWCFHINMDSILVYVGQDESVAKIAGTFLRHFLPGITFMLNYLLLARYLQTQNNILPPISAAICGNIFNLISQYIFVHKLKYGFKASALCFSSSYGIMFLYEFLYIQASKFHMDTWPGFQIEALYDWGHMFGLGIAGVAHTSFEVIIWQACVFMGGILGETQLQTNSLIIQFTTLSFMLYLGVGIGSNIRIGQCLGSKDPERARTAYKAALTIIGVAGSIMTSIIMLVYQYIPRIFTDKPQVIAMVRDTFPAVFLLIFLDPFSGVFIGCIRGCGRQKFGAIVMFFAFYVVALPTSIGLAFFTNLNIKGIWIGNTIGSFTAVTIDFLMLECQDWELQSIKAEERIQFSSYPSEKKPLLPGDNSSNSDSNNDLIIYRSRKMVAKRVLMFIFVILLLTASILIQKYISFPTHKYHNITIQS